jgi:RNA polymerase sigma factor FliA
MTQAAPSHRELIESHQGLVKSLAVQVQRKFRSRIELDDLVAYGQVGLAEAAREFDASRGTQFSTYAYYRVRGAIYDGLGKMTWGERQTRRQVKFEQMAGETLNPEAQESPPGDIATESAEDQAAWLVRVTRQLAVVYLASDARDPMEIASGRDD